MNTKSTSIGLIIALWSVPSCDAFLSPIDRISPVVVPLDTRTVVASRAAALVSVTQQQQHPYPRPPRGDVSVWLFRDLFKKIKGGGDEDDDDADEAVIVEGQSNDDVSADTDTVNGAPQPGKGAATPFFANQFLKQLEDSTATVIDETKPVLPVVEKKEKQILLSPMEQAESLRAQAARIRLEADKRQVELTLEKIAKLESKLERLKGKEKVDATDQNSLEEELLRLKSQLTTDEVGEIKIVAPMSNVAAQAKLKVVATTPSTSSSSSSSSAIQSSDKPSSPTRPSLSSSELDERVKRFRDAPEFMQVLVAKLVGFDSTIVDRLNATEIVQKMYDDEMKYVKSDFRNKSEEQRARDMIERAYRNSEDAKDDERDEYYDDMPIFTEEEIQAKVEELQDIPQFLKNMVVKNETELALMMLEDEWIDKNKKKKNSKGGFFGLFGGQNDNEKGDIGRDGERMDIGGTRGAFSRMFTDDSSLNGTSYGQPRSDVDFMMNSLYPQSTRKEGQTPEKRLVDAFLNDIVAPTKSFTPSDNPLPVNGGWIIRGKNECKSGDELIEKLDRRIANDARLREKISFFILKDPFPNPEEQMLDPLNWPQVLFVAGPDVARDPAPILRTVVSAFGIATTWYGSIYPFLVNPKLLDRATEAMELADAGMPTDLSWLSEMSIPLFVSFMAVQLIHEIAHQIVAKSRNFEATVPTLVPSVLSGITSSITSLKSSPKNKQDLVDFAVAGPLTGMIGSILLLCYGLALTATADASMVQTFPGIPLVILRQSSLGGGLIDIFLGNGVLNVPASAEGAQALASTLIALHPFAVAGFFALVVNALALVPAGRTDGGRISMALFGRSGCQAVTFAALASLFILGITQSDLLLFYFAFIAFFQSELEIPMRNEVDDVGFSRVILASFAGFIMLLTLIPM